MVAMGDAAVENAFRIRGDLDSSGTVDVPEGSVIEGAVQARRVRISGVVRGPVSAREGIVVMASGTIEGALKAGTLDVQEGGVCRGQCRVGRRSVAEEEPGPVAAQAPPEERWFWQR